MSLFTRIANRIIQRVVPPLPQADWFTQFEAHNEVWEPHQLAELKPRSACVRDARCLCKKPNNRK